MEPNKDINIEIKFLYNEILNHNNQKLDISLMYGQSGKILFLFEYAAKYNSRQALDKANHWLEEIPVRHKVLKIKCVTS